MNALDGVTIFRFAHAFETGGGTERYLEDLDRVLMERNRVRIVRLQLTREKTATELICSVRGQGALEVQGLPVRHLAAVDSAAGATERQNARHRARDAMLYNPLVWRLLGRRVVTGYRINARDGEAIGAGAAAERLIARGKPQLAVLHFCGGRDAEEVLDVAQRSGIPCALVNHYANERWRNVSICKHALRADGVAGVTGRNPPAFIADRLVNVADGIDTDFFYPHPPEMTAAPALLVLPARVVREKGHADLLRAVHRLRSRNIPARIVFAGRHDSDEYYRGLISLSHELRLADTVEFSGALPLDQLRGLYRVATAMALPTYHHEGLPRVVLEAQATGCPVVAYDQGGIRDAVIDGKTGFVLAAGDIEGLAARLETVITQPAVRASLSREARRLTEGVYSLAALAERHERFYIETMARSG